MQSVDLSPFGFTGTESLVYATLLRVGTATGYALAQASRLARANVYGALGGLAARGAATVLPGRPARYRATDPAALVALLAERQAADLDRLEQALAGVRGAPSLVVHEVRGERPVGNVVLRLVARAETRVAGAITPELWRLTLPAWRRAAARARLEVLATGPVAADEGLLAGSDPRAFPVLVVDDRLAVTTAGTGADTVALWSEHQAFVALAQRALPQQAGSPQAAP